MDIIIDYLAELNVNRVIRLVSIVNKDPKKRNITWVSNLVLRAYRFRTTKSKMFVNTPVNTDVIFQTVNTWTIKHFFRKMK